MAIKKKIFNRLSRRWFSIFYHDDPEVVLCMPSQLLGSVATGTKPAKANPSFYYTVDYSIDCFIEYEAALTKV